MKIRYLPPKIMERIVPDPGVGPHLLARSCASMSRGHCNLWPAPLLLPSFKRLASKAVTVIHCWRLLAFKRPRPGGREPFWHMVCVGWAFRK